MADKTIPDTKELAQTYTVVNNTQYDAGLFLLRQLQLTPGMRVLDVGCGPGNITSYLADLVGSAGEVVGVDPSAERIDLARAKAASSSGAKLSFHVGVAEDLSRFEDASFDALYCNSTLHWVGDQPKALREFARVLRPGGRLGVSGQSGDFTADHEAIRETVLSREPYKAYDHALGQPRFLKQKEMEQLLAEASFGNHEFKINTIYKSAANSDEMISWLESSSSGGTYGGIPVDMRPQARKEMLVEWDKLVKEDGGLKMQLDLLVTVAHKPSA